MIMRAARLLAIGIALLACLDPAVKTARPDRPLVSVIATHSAGDSDLAERVVRALEPDFDVIRAPLDAADAAVLVGSPDIARPDGLPRVAFAVKREAEPSVRIESVGAPDHAAPEEVVPVTVSLRIRGAAGRSVTATLRAGGGVVDRVEVPVAAADTILSVLMRYVPGGPGVVTLAAAVSLDEKEARATRLLSVASNRWPVLFFDPRPSWISTFVRRVLEQDPRFEVTSRVVTSRAVAAESGDPPPRLGGPDVSRFSTIVVGTPGELSAADVAALERFLRGRGGSVVLLLDTPSRGPFVDLIGNPEWRAEQVVRASRISGRLPGSGLRAGELVWPVRLSPGARVIGAADSAGSAVSRPVVWELAVGAGRIVVSGALDAWRFRDPSQSGFTEFWSALISEASARAVPPLVLTLDHSTVRPGEVTSLSVVARDLAFQPERRPYRAAFSAWLEPLSEGAVRETLRLWPGIRPGTLWSQVPGGLRPGLYRVVVESASGSSAVPLLVSPEAAAPKAARDGALAALVATRGGEVVEAGRLDDLPGKLLSAFRPTARVETWYPMRSAWWIAPFVLLLGVEWWWRRRHGLA